MRILGRQIIYLFVFQIDEVKSNYNTLRRNMAATFNPIYQQAVRMGEAVGTEPSAPRIVARQRHRSNIMAEGVEQHYLRNLAIPLIDHICNEMELQFSGGQLVIHSCYKMLRNFTKFIN